MTFDLDKCHAGLPRQCLYVSGQHLSNDDCLEDKARYTLPVFTTRPVNTARGHGWCVPSLRLKILELFHAVLCTTIYTRDQF